MIALNFLYLKFKQTVAHKNYMLDRLILTTKPWSIWLIIFAMAWSVVGPYFTTTNKDGSVIVQLIDFLEEEPEKDDKKPAKDKSIKINSFQLNQLSNHAQIHASKALDFRELYTLHIPEIPDPPPD